MKEKLLLLFVSIFLSIGAVSAQKTIKGVVSEEDGTPLIGVSVAVKGGTPLAVTDLDGQYTASVAEGAVLVFSYLGMENEERKVHETTSVIDVVMKPLTTQITELVVTAMGVSQEKKKLNFAVQSLNSDELLQSKPTNFVSALQGKVSGLNLTTAGGSPNSASQIVIRGISSINPSMSNEPIFIIDGMHVSGGASAAAAINPNDIENVTVLKGAAASALYGQEAANGAILITTKTGAKGKMTINTSATMQIDNVTRAPEIQSLFEPGANGVLKKYTMGGWGPYVQPGTKTYDNVGDYFKTGLLQKYDMSASGGSDKFSTYASVSYLSQTGIIPNDYVNRVTAMLKASFDPSPTVNLSFMANVANSESRDADGAMTNLYSWPITDQMSNYYEDGAMRLLFPYDFSNTDPTTNPISNWATNPINPYWKRYRDSEKGESTRNLLQMAGSWKPVKGLTLSGRLGYDQSSSYNNGYTVERLYRTDLTDLQQESINQSSYGTYTATKGKSTTFTAQAMATYRLEVHEDLGIETLLGTETKLRKGLSSSMAGQEFIVPNFYSYNNTDTKTQITSNNRSKRKIYAFFGELRFDYKGLLQLSGTLRNDHTSTLQPGNRSYFYPSITGGLIFSELFNLRSDFFDYGKLRGNWAKVGKDTNPYLFGQKFAQKKTFPDGGMGVNPTLSVADDNLQPEMSTSWEIGADLRFFKGKTRLDIAYYSTAVSNQIVTVRVSPAAGAILKTLNEGDIENKGLELSLDQEIYKNKDFKWNAVLNFSFNRGKVKGLPNELTEVSAMQVGDAFAVSYLHGSTTAITGKDYLRNDAGQVIVDADGLPQINPNKSILIGNREPDFIAGLTNTFKYKEFDLSFLFDFRKGGDVYNNTARSMWGNGQHKRLETYRNREIVFDGVVLQDDGSYLPNTKSVIFDQQFVTNYFTSVTSNFIEDGSFIRLSYVTLGYDFSKFVKKSPIKSLNLSVTGRNLFLLTRYSGADPSINQGATGGAGSVGFDNMNVPNTRSFSIGLNATF